MKKIKKDSSFVMLTGANTISLLGESPIYRGSPVNIVQAELLYNSKTMGESIFLFELENKEE